MPKVVDHAARRRELVQATWRIIARNGLSGATMREIAAEAGYANGALKPYFATKADLIEATYAYVFDRTNDRVARAVVGLTGLAALEAFCRQVLPLDAVRLDEARVVIPFWQEAAQDAGRAELNNRSMAQWRASMAGWLVQARTAGDLAPRVDVPTSVEVLLTFLLGAQITAALDPAIGSPRRLEQQLQAQLELLRAHPGAAVPGTG
ncbi:TetR/AcrR family transcriptional regulator [uncultured Kocuria sp.]|uniref:TetR/AcrR family transcriptional regulator n=1 Tax=uncultured Kocuria sp. TaxID=259305 RepID=UPI00261514E3|nr:TetR/AcrR family transcriptional regulator [uncultured Kocuria sp.]